MIEFKRKILMKSFVLLGRSSLLFFLDFLLGLEVQQEGFSQVVQLLTQILVLLLQGFDFLFVDDLHCFDVDVSAIAQSWVEFWCAWSNWYPRFLILKINSSGNAVPLFYDFLVLVVNLWQEHVLPSLRNVLKPTLRHVLWIKVDVLLAYVEGSRIYRDERIASDRINITEHFINW